MSAQKVLVDATFIADSPDLVRDLLAEVERLRERKANVARTGGYIAGVMQRERDEALAEVARLEGDLDGAAYRAGRKQGELAEARAAVDRVRALHESGLCGCGCGDTVCGVCVGDTWPCATLRALDGEATS